LAQSIAMTVVRRNDLLMIVGLATLCVAIALVAFDPAALATVIVLPAIIVAALTAWGILRGQRTVVLTLVFAAVFLIDAIFRVRDYQDKGVDFQVFIKVALWATVVFAAVVHLQRWRGNMLSAVNIPWIAFLAWLAATATVSVAPAYSAVAAFSIFAYVVFCAYVFAVFTRVEVFAAVVAAIAAFCLVSLAVYVAIPEFGHYVYWVNGQRFISPRLAGIAGSANNMGRIAAFGLVLVTLFYAEFRRINRLFVPATAAIMGLALVLSNSRTSMVMLAGIVGTLLLLNRQRFYLAVFALATATLAVAVALPFEEEVLRLTSRSGSAGEITSVTGRTEIWHAVLKLAQDRPWSGYGYATSVFVLPQHEREIGFLTSHAHNLILQLLLTTGWIGVALFSLGVITTGLQAVFRGDRVVIVMLAFVLLNGLTEASGFTTLANICTFAFAIAITLPPAAEEPDDHYRPYQRRLS
jgi:exopolysaccharide production protein ExoQ